MKRAAIATLFLLVPAVAYADLPAVHNLNDVVDEDSSQVVDLRLSNIDSDGLVYSIAGQPGHGTLCCLNPVGVVTYTPAANYNGSDSFVFEVGNGTATTTASVFMTVNPVNDPLTLGTAAPVAAVAGELVAFESPLDIDGTILTWSLESAPMGASISSTGAFAWQTSTTSAGVHHVVMKGTDSDLNFATADVEITLSDPPPLPAPAVKNRRGGGGGSIRRPLPAVVDATPAGQILGTSTFAFSADLAYGATGSDVEELQKRLIAGGYLQIPQPTGLFGPLTLAAVKKYQTAHDIFATGFVGPLTRGALNYH